MEGLTILYEEQVISGSYFNPTFYWTWVSATAILFFLGPLIISLIARENWQTTVMLTLGVGFLSTGVLGFGLGYVANDAIHKTYESQYIAIIDYKLIDQQEFQENYEIVEQKGTAYIIRER